EQIILFCDYLLYSAIGFIKNFPENNKRGKKN
ncbi:unnamed protein product, partial [marine sediment metagenome]